jgi:hypothetical protein
MGNAYIEYGDHPSEKYTWSSVKILTGRKMGIFLTCNTSSPIIFCKLVMDSTDQF